MITENIISLKIATSSKSLYSSDSKWGTPLRINTRQASNNIVKNMGILFSFQNLHADEEVSVANCDSVESVSRFLVRVTARRDTTSDTVTKKATPNINLEINA